MGDYVSGIERGAPTRREEAPDLLHREFACDRKSMWTYLLWLRLRLGEVLAGRRGGELRRLLGANLDGETEV